MWNKIGEKGGIVLAEMPQLQNLYLSHNSIPCSCVRKYLTLPQLQVLDVRFNELTNSEREAIRAGPPTSLQLFL